MPGWGILAAAVLMVGLGAVALSGLSRNPVPAEAGQYTPRPAPTVEAPAERTRIAVVGDSNTAVNSPDLAAGDIGDASWVRVLLRSGFSFAGGWAVGGTPSATQANALAPVSDADVLLIMTGTNDLGTGVPWDETVSNIDAMHEKVPAGRVVLLAIAPRDEETDPSSVEFNGLLEQLADDRGWEFFDGMVSIRAVDGGFVDGASNDGVHLNRASQADLGRAIADYLTAG